MRRFDLFKLADTDGSESAPAANYAAADGDVYTPGTSGLYAATCSAHDARVYSAAEATNSGLYATATAADD